MSVSAPEKDVDNVHVFQGGFGLKHLPRLGTTTYDCSRDVIGTAGYAFTHTPHPGVSTSLKEPCGAYRRKCLFIYSLASYRRRQASLNAVMAWAWTMKLAGWARLVRVVGHSGSIRDRNEHRCIRVL
jgi:hypothetical protein